MELLSQKITHIEEQIRLLNTEKGKCMTEYIQQVKTQYPTVYVLFKVKKNKSGMPDLIPIDPIHSCSYGCFSTQQLAEEYTKTQNSKHTYLVRPEASMNVSDFRLFNIDKLFE